MLADTLYCTSTCRSCHFAWFAHWKIPSSSRACPKIPRYDPKLQNKYPQSHFGPDFDRLKKFDVLRIEKHVSHSASSPVYFVGITAKNYSLQNYMQWIAFDQFSIHDWTRLDPLRVDLVDSVNREWCRREAVVVVKGTVVLVFIILLNFLCKFSLVCPIYAPWKYWCDEDLPKTHCYKIFLVWLYFWVIQRVVRISLHSSMNHCHFSFVF